MWLMYAPMWNVTLVLAIMAVGISVKERTMAFEPKSEASPLTKEQGNVLVLSMPAYSRWFSLVNIAHELKKFGYTTTFVFPDGQGRQHMTGVDEADIIVSEGMTKYGQYLKENVGVPIIKHGTSTGSTTPFSFYLHFGKLCPLVAGDKHLIQELEHRHFDLVIIDTNFVNPCLSVIPYKLSVPFIHFGALFEIHHIRSLIHPSVYPVLKFLPFTDRMTYLERLYNTLLYLGMLILPDPINPSDIVGTYAPEKPHLTNEELKAKTELYLLDHDELIDYHLPTYPNMVYVGGAATQPAAPLTGDLKSFLDTAKDGAILITFGSVVNALPSHIINIIRKAFEMKRNIKAILKHTVNETKINGNVMTMPWVPQNDILGHPNTKLFISHCGHNAQVEALYHAVPIICLPIFGDQHYNAMRMHRKGYGLYLNIAKFTADTLTSAVDEILTNPSYQQNITKASNIFKSRPMTPSQRAAWWIDHVIKYGGNHLHPAVTDLPYYQFLMLDVLAGFMFVFVLVLVAFDLLYRCIRRRCFRKVKPKRA